MDTRIYVVRPTTKAFPPGGPVPSSRLVRAAHPNSVRRHIAESLFDVHVASQDDLEALLTTSVRVEIAGADVNDPE
jgi:hypothetical protein